MRFPLSAVRVNFVRVHHYLKHFRISLQFLLTSKILREIRYVKLPHHYFFVALSGPLNIDNANNKLAGII